MTLQALLRNCSERVARLLKSESSDETADRAASTESLGFSRTLEQSRRELSRTLADLRRAKKSGSAGLERPFVLDSTRACISTYAEALDLVQSRFWTTTYLSSGFWTSRDERIIGANARMMQRLREQRGHVRRLFLLDRPPHEVAESYRERWIFLDRMGQKEDLEQFDTELSNLQRNIRAQAADGCEVRVVFDGDRTFAGLQERMGWRPDDSELAIYDRFRVDLFEGGHSGRINQVTSFSRAMTEFDDYLTSAQTFFEQLWDRAGEMEEFLVHLEEAVQSSRNKIHYRANWLARYEFALDHDDSTLKRAEAASLEQAIRERGRWGRVCSYLDVGTCTGRYLLFLRDAVAPDGIIVGIDDDPECVRFAMSNVARHGENDRRVDLIRADFCARNLTLPNERFDLVSCMMSTLSHFGSERREDHDDALQTVLARVAGLLDPGGLFVFSTWSQHARDSGGFLSIYDETDCRRLAEWTPDRAELGKRLTSAGFKACRVSQPDPRLDFWTCEKGS